MSQKAVFANGEVISLNGYSISEDMVSLHYERPCENQSGFVIYSEAGEIVMDCSDFRYRWDVIDQKEDRIYYTNDPDHRQTEPWPEMNNVPEQAEPLSNEELTEAVADLMYEVSMAQIGL